MSSTRRRWEHLARLVYAALAILCGIPGAVMILTGDTEAARNALDLPIGWAALLWFFNVPFTEDSR